MKNNNLSISIHILKAINVLKDYCNSKYMKQICTCMFTYSSK